MTLFLAAEYALGQAPNHTLLGPYLAATLELLTSVLQLAFILCVHVWWIHHWLVEVSRVLVMMHHSSCFWVPPFRPTLLSVIEVYDFVAVRMRHMKFVAPASTDFMSALSTPSLASEKRPAFDTLMTVALPIPCRECSYNICTRESMNY